LRKLEHVALHHSHFPLRRRSGSAIKHLDRHVAIDPGHRALNNVQGTSVPDGAILFACRRLYLNPRPLDLACEREERPVEIVRVKTPSGGMEMGELLTGLPAICS
jgi:hypothetical protein